MCARGKEGDAVAVRHPHLRFGRDSFQQRRIGHYPQLGAAIFAGVGCFDFAAAGMGQVLGAVADAQKRSFAAQQRQVYLRGIGVAHGAGTARQDHAFDAFVEEGNLVVRIDFAVNIDFAEAASDELGYLGAEVEDDDLFNHGTKIRNSFL